MNQLKINHLRAVNKAIDCINLEFKAFKKSVPTNYSYAASNAKEFKLDSQRKIVVCVYWDNKQGYQIVITCFFGYYGQTEKKFTYLPIHTEVRFLLSLACSYNQRNKDAHYAQQERSFTGCSGQ